MSVGLIQSDLTNYYNKEKSILEHYKYAVLFIRRTKKSYISIVNDFIVNITLKAYSKPSHNAIKLLLLRRNLDVNLYYCRRIFSTYLRNQGIESEIIDMLQEDVVGDGNIVDNSMLMRRY